MKSNYTITIGRQFGSCGKSIGQRLAEELGIAFYDKELITLASRESGLCPEFFEKADERNSRNLLHTFAMGFPFGSFQYSDVLSNDRLFQIQSDVIRKLAEEHSCVLVGRCADYILRDKTNCFNVFIHAPLANRIRTVQERDGISEQAARELVLKMDKTRPSYYNYYTDKTWGMASSYHLSVDSSLLGIEGTVDIIYKLVKCNFF